MLGRVISDISQYCAYTRERDQVPTHLTELFQEQVSIVLATCQQQHEESPYLPQEIPRWGLIDDIVTSLYNEALLRSHNGNDVVSDERYSLRLSVYGPIIKKKSSCPNEAAGVHRCVRLLAIEEVER